MERKVSSSSALSSDSTSIPFCCPSKYKVRRERNLARCSRRGFFDLVADRDKPLISQGISARKAKFLRLATPIERDSRFCRAATFSTPSTSTRQSAEK